jgi:pyridoxine kinase
VRPAVVVISSHVARGTVGNRAIVFALEALGFPVWAVPTVMLPWHPGHGPAPRIVPDRRQTSPISWLRWLPRRILAKSARS